MMKCLEDLSSVLGIKNRGLRHRSDVIVELAWSFIYRLETCTRDQMHLGKYIKHCFGMYSKEI